MFIKSLNGIQASILAPTILQSRQNSPVQHLWPSLLWAVLMCTNQFKWKSRYPGLLPQGAKLQCLRWRWRVSGTQMQIQPPLWDETCTCKGLCLFVSAKIQPVCAHTRPWLLLCFLKHGQMHFLWVYGSKLTALPLQWGPRSKAVPAEDSAAIAVLLGIWSATYFKNASCAF